MMGKGNEHPPPVWKRKTPWSSRLRTKSITKAELAKRPDPFFLPNLLDGFAESKFGWLVDDVKRLIELKRQLLINGSISLEDFQATQHERGEKSVKKLKTADGVAVLDDDGEEDQSTDNSPQACDEDDSSDHDNGDEEEVAQLWKQMAFAQESSKITVESPGGRDLKVEDCEHSFICKDDVGEVCRVCGLIKTPIHCMIEVLFNKPKTRSRRTYMMREQEHTEESRAFLENRSSHTEILGEKMFIHPRHDREMRPHQTEGFRFLCNNLGGDEPGGCVLAHAPGSGKTFLLISFMQSFMAMDPQSKPLIVLPKGIIDTWKREFTQWAVESIPLLDFYSVKAESRKQQLEVLRQWVEQRSILFLGYQQFAKIICDDKDIEEAVSDDCKRILLEKPTLLILDEGHTSRNKETNMLISLARVRTPRKVVLTGTLFQNNVEEVFNILNLVRPKFLKRHGTREMVSRIMSRAEIPPGKHMNQSSFEATFFASVELTLKSVHSSAKASLIKDLREMTRSILHYHKADFSGMLPGLSEFTVMLNLSSIQREKVKGLRKMELFKQISLGAALYVHPKLASFLEENPSNGEKGFADTTSKKKIEQMVKEMNVRDGVKMKFFLNLVALCESTGEKLVVFSQYIAPIKTLEKLMSWTKGWNLGREMFTITGDSSNEQREISMERFNNSPEAKVLFGSIRACGEGISLVGASRVLILDVHLNPSVTQQAVARAYRPGQRRKVYAYRLVAADSPEEEGYETCCRKEMMSKMWFEWNVGSGREGEFGYRAIDVDHCKDEFLESTKMREDIKCLYTR